jgi:hypothetical protein
MFSTNRDPAPAAREWAMAHCERYSAQNSLCGLKCHWHRCSVDRENNQSKFVPYHRLVRCSRFGLVNCNISIKRIKMAVMAFPLDDWIHSIDNGIVVSSQWDSRPSVCEPFNGYLRMQHTFVAWWIFSFVLANYNLKMRTNHNLARDRLWSRCPLGRRSGGAVRVAPAATTSSWARNTISASHGRRTTAESEMHTHRCEFFEICSHSAIVIFTRCRFARLSQVTGLD